MDRVNVLESSAFRAKAEKVSRLRGGVIMDCTTPDQARIAEARAGRHQGGRRRGQDG